MKYIAGIDLGGTNIKAALVDENFDIVARSMTQTPYLKPAEITFSRIFFVIEELLKSKGITKEDLLGIGIGIPGLTDSRTNIAHEVKFLRWSDMDVAKPIREHFGVPVFAENDGSVNALGELHFGAGRGYNNLILLTIGTGLGAGVIIDGNILRGQSYVAGEIGHMVIDPAGDRCVCGKYGCFESCCSGTALVRYARRFVLDYPDSVLVKYTNSNIFTIDGEMISRGYDAGDAACIKTFELFSQKLSVGIVNLIDIFNPGLIIISGGVSRAGERILTPVREMVFRSLMHPLQKCDIKAGELFTDAGVLGATVVVARALGRQDRLSKRGETDGKE